MNNEMLLKSCSPQLRIAILNDEIALWEKRFEIGHLLKEENASIELFNERLNCLGFVKTTLTERVKELESYNR